MWIEICSTWAYPILCLEPQGKIRTPVSARARSNHPPGDADAVLFLLTHKPGAGAATKNAGLTIKNGGTIGIQWGCDGKLGFDHQNLETCCIMGIECDDHPCGHFFIKHDRLWLSLFDNPCTTLQPTKSMKFCTMLLARGRIDRGRASNIVTVVSLRFCNFVNFPCIKTSTSVHFVHGNLSPDARNSSESREYTLDAIGPIGPQTVNCTTTNIVESAIQIKIYF